MEPTIPPSSGGKVHSPDYASLGSRLVAFFIDVLILLIPGGLLHFGIPFAGPIVLGFFYYPLLHSSAMQATLGKKLMGIKVTNSMGDPLTLPMAILRYFVEAASSCLCFVGHALALFSEKRQAVHDLVADSVVIRGENVGVRFLDAWLDSLKQLFGAGQKAYEKIQSQVPSPARRNQYDELDRLFELHKKGALTDAEYQRLKSELMNL